MSPRPETPDTSIASAAGSFDVLSIYNAALLHDPEITMPLAAISALLEVLTKTNASTVSEFMDILRRGKAILINAVPNSYSLQAGCDIFQRFVVRSLTDIENFEETKAHLVSNGQLFMNRAKQARDTISTIGARFIKNGQTILIHSYSRVVLAVLTKASESIKFRVLITESRPNGSGLKSKAVLESHGIPCCMLLDVAVGYAMSMTDLILVGAEGIFENGALVNQIGTLNVAQLAKASGKALYCLAESHKFVRIFPLSQKDLAQNVLTFSDPKAKKTDEVITSSSADVANEEVMSLEAIANNPQLDLTPPELITGLITDLGVLNPMSGVSEELIRLYGP